MPVCLLPMMKLVCLFGFFSVLVCHATNTRDVQTQTEDIVEGIPLATAPPDDEDVPRPVPIQEVPVVENRFGFLLSGFQRIEGWFFNWWDYFQQQRSHDRFVMIGMIWMLLHQGARGKDLHFRF